MHEHRGQVHDNVIEIRQDQASLPWDNKGTVESVGHNRQGRLVSEFLPKVHSTTS